MKKMLTIASFIFSSILFADVSVWVCNASQVSGDTWTFSVCADSDSNIAGYQFGVDVEDFTVTSVSNGAASANVLSENGQTFSLAFSFTGGFIEAGSNLELAVFEGTVAQGSTGGSALVVAGGGSLAVSDQSAQNLSVNVINNGWDGSTLGSELSLPGVYSLEQAYPNPFNPSTTIDYTLKENSEVSIIVYDLMGREVKTLVNEFQLSNGGSTHSVVWNGTDNSGQMASSGIYIYRMVSNDFTKSHRITLMK